MTFITRFAPSPTGPLHLGHAYSALLAHDMAVTAGGRFLLRIEDIDRSRARDHWETQIYEDLDWLGIRWEQPVLRQSDQMAAYDMALDHLWDMGLLYPCTCTRRDIETALSAPQEGAVPLGPDGMIYPGTCRWKHPRTGPRPTDTALRLDMARATQGQDGAIYFKETGQYTDYKIPLYRNAQLCIGDIVVSRRDMGTSYHLSVVVDDAAQGITHVIRGADLLDATAIHAILQGLLGLTTPIYHHHRLIRDEAGKRLAKRDDARAISTYRAAGWTADDIRDCVMAQVP